MAQFNAIERKIANILSKMPGLKNFAKVTYQYLSYIVYRKKGETFLHPDVALGKPDAEHNTFWGYYDKSPERNGNYLLHSYDANSKKYSSPIEILLNGKSVGKTTTWNWQQGAMASWVNDNEFIHNCFEGGDFKSCLVNKNTLDRKLIDSPIYSMSKDGTFALTLNFSILAKLRPDYGYINKEYKNLVVDDAKDGVFYVDLALNAKQLIISFEHLKQFHPRPEMINAEHKVNHLDISPDNKRFIFIHRWLDKNGQKWSRLISANIDGSEMYLLADDDMVSHCTWRNATEIVGWMRRKIEGNHYYLLTDKTQNYSIVGAGTLTEDGHPGFSKDGRWLLTDTYPDKSRLSSLLLFDMHKSKLICLGKFLSPMRYRGQVRCDLHPRFNHTEDGKVTFDSVHEGERNVFELDITKIIEKDNAK